MRTLVVGSGFVGRAVARHLEASGGTAVVASRTPPAADHGPPPSWTPLDVTEPGAFARALDRSRAESIVLVHGPSDVTWCERYPDEAMAGHAGAARQVVESAGDRRVVFISTDNVFDGGEEMPRETSRPRPANAYGRAKLAAEDILAAHARTTVLRVSLIYGWEAAESTKWLNFFASCAHRLRLGERIDVPFDQWTTPVLIDDVAAVTAALTLAPSGPPLLHLGGPDAVSRADWAADIARQLGASQDLVVPVPRAAGRYAGRPARTCLASDLLSTDPVTAPVPPRGVREGTRFLLAHAPDGLLPTPGDGVAAPRTT